MRLWSLRKELRRISLPKKAKNYLLFCTMLYNEEKDLYIGVSSGDPDQPSVWTDAAMVKIYHASLALLLEFQAHKSSICAAIFNNERQELVTSGGGYDSVLRVWNVVRPESDEQGVLMTQRGVISSTDDSVDVLYRKDNLLFGASGTDVWMWDQDTLETIRFVQLAVGGDINVLCYSTESNVLHTGSVDGEITCWDMDQQEPKQLTTCQAHNGQVNDLWLEAGAGLFSCGDDGNVYQWDVNRIESGQELGQYKFDLNLQTKYHPAAKNLSAVPRQLVVQHIDVPACHKELLFVFAGGLITLLEVHAPQRNFARANDMVVAMKVSRPLLSDFSQDGSASTDPEIVVLSQNNTLQVVDSRSGKVKRSIEPPAKKYIGALSRGDHQRKRARGVPGTQASNGDRPIFSEKMTASGGYGSSWGGSKGLLKPVGHWPDKAVAASEICTFTTMDEAGCFVLGWSDGSVELLGRKSGLRELLLEDPSVTTPISSLCLLPQLAQGPRSRHALHHSSSSEAAQMVHGAHHPVKQEEFGGKVRRR